MCAQLLKFFASLGGQYQIMQICYNDYVIVKKVVTEVNFNRNQSECFEITLVHCGGLAFFNIHF